MSRLQSFDSHGGRRPTKVAFRSTFLPIEIHRPFANGPVGPKLRPVEEYFKDQSRSRTEARGNPEGRNRLPFKNTKM